MSYQDYAERRFSKARKFVRERIKPQRGRFSEYNMKRACMRLLEVLRQTNWILKDGYGRNITIKRSTLQVFECLFMGFHNRISGRINPKNATIAKKLGVSSATVQRATRELEEVGLIRKIEHFVFNEQTGRHDQRSNYFYLAKDLMAAMFLLLRHNIEKGKSEEDKTNSLFSFFLTVGQRKKKSEEEKKDDLAIKKHQLQMSLLGVAGEEEQDVNTDFGGGSRTETITKISEIVEYWQSREQVPI